MHGIFLMAAAAVLLAPLGAAAQFKCVAADGAVSFQQQPCAGGARQSKLDLPPPQPAPAATPGVALPELARLETMGRERRVRELQYEIRDTENALENRTATMERELQQLRRQRSRAANNLAGATLRNSISAEMQAVTAKYQALNDIDLERLRGLRGELALVR